MGRSGSRTEFALREFARTPFGRGRVRLESEVKPLGTLFDGTGRLAQAAWTNSGATGVQLDQIVSGLSGSTPYHWRLRTLFHPATSPFQAHGPWISPAFNGAQETDLRTSGIGDLAVSATLAPGAALLLEEVLYRFSVTNAGPDRGTAVLTIALPADANFLGYGITPGSCSASNAGGSWVIACPNVTVATGGAADPEVRVSYTMAGMKTVQASLSGSDEDPDPTNDAITAQTAASNPPMGDRVWEDRDGDGIQDPAEPGVVSALVYLFDATTGGIVDVTFTDTSGRYRFQVPLGSYFLRFIPPPGFVLAPRDQGGDDQADSDADPATGNTAILSPAAALEATRWDAGMVPSVACVPPDEPIDIYMVTLSTDGNNYPILHFQDGNQPGQITGYNIYRTSNPALPYAQWPLMASDVVDMEWVDTSGVQPPAGGAWYYQVTAFNNRCPAEGPF